MWQLVQGNAGVTQYVLPAPSTIGKALIANRTLISHNATATLLEALGGFLLGNGLAVATAVLFIYSRPLEEMFYPAAVALRSMPLVAITPVVVVVFGPGYSSKLIITALIVFFPTLVNMVQGLMSVEEPTLELMYTMSMNEPSVLWKVRLPYSLPYLFAAMKIAPAAAILGAIIAEWIGSTSGLGYVIVQAMYDFNVSRLWAIMVVATALSVSAFVIVMVAERLAIPWHASVAGAGLREEME